jgi:long-subunit acyl-CoA synthetase (AMP-forming)
MEKEGVAPAGRVAIADSLREPTLCAAFLRTATAQRNQVALSDFGSQRSLLYGEWHRRARLVAGGLSALGVGHGDRVGMLMGNRLEFHVVDMGALVLGAVPYSMYATSPVAQLAPTVQHAAPRVLVTEVELADKANALSASCASIEHVVVVDGERHDLAWLEHLCPTDFDVDATAARVGPEDLCTLVFTSGTTGAAKAVPYLHRGLMETMTSLHGHVPVSESGRVISYLPMAHIAERMFGHYAGFVFGCHITSLADATQLGAALREVRPTRFFGVPRIWEKLLAAVDRALVENFSPADTREIRAAWSRAVERVEAEQAGLQTVPQSSADIETLSVFPAMLGLDSAEWLGVAGAPAGRDTLIALHALGLAVNELYGMSETIIVATNPPDRIKIGSCGVPLPGVNVRIADDGEILVSGVTTMPGYFDQPECSQEALVDGWMHSGDIGSLDADGYLTITDRKKALIINSGGKNMSPAAIEQAIKGGMALIGHVVAYGDRRPYNVALIVLDRDGLEAFRVRCAVPAGDLAELSRRPEVLAEVERAVARGNARLARVEQIKRYVVLDHDWLPASNELTPTAKLKRKSIEERYVDVIEELYAR